jgi:hypothetical protein
MSIDTLGDLQRELDKYSRIGISIPDDLRQEIDKFNKKVKAFLQASREESDSRKRDKSIDEILRLLGRTLFNNVLQKIIEGHEKFPAYRQGAIQKEHGKNVITNDIRHKIQAIHEMLKSWPHMVPPLFENIHLSAGHLQNDMLWASWDDGIEPKWGFVEPPYLKPDSEPCSIENYFESDYWMEDDDVRDETCRWFADYAAGNRTYNPLEEDPAFLSDVMKIHGSKGYIDVFRMFSDCSGSLSDYHPNE